jgi:hypothetical protein
VRRAAAGVDKPNVVRLGFLVGGIDSTILRHGTEIGEGAGGFGAVDNGARDRRRGVRDLDLPATEGDSERMEALSVGVVVSLGLI